MMKKKVCMLGAFAAGKTSLVRQYVYSIFSEKYHTTVGVKIDKKPVKVGETALDLILWDVHGKDEFQDIRMTYLKGCSGCIYVIDGTRRATLDVALTLKDRVEEFIGAVPFILAFNKQDLEQTWEIDTETIAGLQGSGLAAIETSAKTGRGVEDAFHALARMMVKV